MRSIRKLLHHQTYRDRHGATKETRTWYVTIHGKHHPLGEDLVEAEARAKELLARSARRIIASNPSMDDLLQLVKDDYEANRRSSLDHYKSRSEKLRAFFGNPKATALHTGHIRAYQAHRQHEGAKPASVNVELAMLRRGFSLARQDGSFQDAGPTFPRLAEKNARKGFFEREDMERLRSFLPEHLSVLALVAYITGWRKSELLSREWRHVDFSAGWFRLEPNETKNDDGRNFPLTDELRAALQEQRLYVDALQTEHGKVIPWVFPNQKGDPTTHLWFDFDRARKAAGIPQRIFHDFRRTAVRNLERAGVPRSAAMALVGHKTQAMYSRYAIADEGLLTEAGQKLNDFARQGQNAPVKVRAISGGLDFQKEIP
jgi:integrase